MRMKDGLIQDLEKKKRGGLFGVYSEVKEIIKNTNESEAQFVLS